MAIRVVVTRGFGNATFDGEIKFVVTKGYTSASLKIQPLITRLGLYGGTRGLYGDFSAKEAPGKTQPLITRLGLYGGTRGLYGDFSTKAVIPPGKTQPLITRLGLYGGSRGLYGLFSGKKELIIVQPPPPPKDGGRPTKLIMDKQELLTKRLEREDTEILEIIIAAIETGVIE